MNAALIKKDMTVYDLAQLMMQGFAQFDERFERLEARFDGLEARFDASEYRYNKRLEKLEDDSRIVRTKLNLA